MRKLALAGAFLLAMSASSAQALQIEMLKPIVDIKIDISSQKMNVHVNGEPQYSWLVSTGREGHRTPTGTYHPYRVHRHWWSRQYDMLPMHFALFFHRGYAIHASDAIRTLGQPASHGCVRLHPSNAARLFALVQKYGRHRTRIRLTGDWRIAERNRPAPRVAGYTRRASAGDFNPFESFRE